MKITYIYHSSFFVETENVCLLFDYFQGTVPKIPADKPLYIFVSHRHPDHFSKSIFNIAKTHESKKYILSFDIRDNQVPAGAMDKTYFLAPGDTYEDDQLKAEAFKSTDEGIALWVTVDGRQLYFSADLNNWYWEGEDPELNKKMNSDYRHEIGKMAGRHADVAFMALDPRLENNFYLGIDDFMKVVDTDLIFPMHFWNDFDVIQRLKDLPCAESYRDRIVEIEHNGQEFEL